MYSSQSGVQSGLVYSPQAPQSYSLGSQLGHGWHGLTICGSNQFGVTDVDDALDFLFVDDARFWRKPKPPGSLSLVRMCLCQLMIRAVSSPQ